MAGLLRSGLRETLVEAGVAQRIGTKIGNTFLARTERRFIVTVSIICTVMSAFMSNNGCVAMWMPIIAAVAAGSNGRIRSKMVIFPAGTAAIIGGSCTLIGSTSQLAANSILQGYKGYEAGLGMFDMTKVMFPAAVVQIIFWGTIGYPILKWALKPGSPDFDKNNIYAVLPDSTPDTYGHVPAWKGNVALFTMLGCIICFILSGFAPFNNFLNIGIIGMLGASIILGTGCLPVNKAFADLPWDVLFCIGAISGLGTGLDVSGGGALIVESEEHALQRGAEIFAELAGYANTSDGYHVTSPDPEGTGAINCMRLALSMAEMKPEDIGYINAHGTSTPLGDPIETRAIKAVFGQNPPPVSSTKGATGHLMGAGGITETIACIQAIRTGILPPTLGYQTPDPECDLDYIPNQARESAIETAMSNALGFGGQNSSIIIRKYR